MELLTKDILKNNIEGLTDEQAETALKLLSNRIGQVHGDYERDLEVAFGRKKPAGVKTYEWAKEEIEKMKTAAPDNSKFEKQIEDLKAEKTALEAKIKTGTGDEALKVQLENKDKEIGQLKTMFEQEKTTWQNSLNEKESAMSNLQLNWELSGAFNSLKRKDESIVAKPLQNAAFESAKSNLLRDYKASFENGKTIWKDGEGKPLLNKDNNLEPYTTAELLSQRDEIKAIIDTGVNGTGAGTKGGAAKTVTVLNIGTAKTRTEATEMIREQLFNEGLSTSDTKFQDRFNEAYKENNVSSLPLR